MARETEKERFRSFAERYVVARAPSFRAAHEKEDAWLAVEDAKRIYLQIGETGDRAFADNPTAGQATQAPPPTRPRRMPGLNTGPMGPPGAVPANPPIQPAPAPSKWWHRLGFGLPDAGDER